MAEVPKALQESVDATKVSYKQLGKCGLRVSVPILGAMSFGHKDWQPWVVDDDEEVNKLLKGAYDQGLNTWDTANVYSNGVSETMIGNAIKKYDIPRHKLVLLTKCFGTVGETPAVMHMKYTEQIKESKDYQNQGGLSRAAVFNAVDASLERLQTSYIDLLQIHRFDPTVPVEETMKALHDLVQSGKVRYIGASSMWTYQFAKLQTVAETHNWTKFVSMQNHYSLCYREEEREMNKYCNETGVGLIPWSPLYRGLLARPLGSAATVREESTKATAMGTAVSEADKTIIKRVEELAQKKGWKMSHVALAWILQKGTIPIVGFSNLGRLEEATEVRGKSLTEDEIKYLEEPYQPKNIAGHM
ncbi:putative NADP-dependent oxidoreductase domain-containing protein [Seiridium unicorne]|uniref:NADP-dependent oxidoreductase domain-containing protein n=1 Tax=Seiridium unicorne TaxID=138068 RepID=A0ABR2UGE8_9PEZI